MASVRPAQRAAGLLPFIPTDGQRGSSKDLRVVHPPRRFPEASTPLVFRHQGLQVLSALSQFLPQDLLLKLPELLLRRVPMDLLGKPAIVPQTAPPTGSRRLAVGRHGLWPFIVI
ncbi:hypothetical protein EYF80_000269 [Liparis tanakae]|uniref:Uncharacterized protein n=1 Tax=Liparis tanakae TaxID=230148 RepID=A0A4Z2JH88_9TELE|nr:hypothetical protein EYF80_000269 [Liparis tanakae]